MAKSLGLAVPTAEAAMDPHEIEGPWRPAPAEADAHGFAALVGEHQAMVYSLAYHFLHDRSAAEDLTQDVFLTLYQNLHTIQSPSHLRHWLRQVTSRRCIDLARRARLRRFLSLGAVPEPATESHQPDPAMERRLQALVAALPARLRMTLLLRYQEELEPAEIAAVLGVSINTVKSHLRRSLDLLRRKLGGQLQGVPK
jgi:RNA polymerase sigma-70 factor (ECF subfamily)